MENDDRLLLIPVEDIQTDEKNPRKDAEKGLSSLADSIKDFGLLQPITLVRDGAAYRVVDGHRRLLAARKAGLKQVEAKVIELPREKLPVCSLVADRHHVRLTPLEVALKCKELVDGQGLTQERLAMMLGLGKSTLSEYVSLLSLPEGIQRDYMEQFGGETECDPDKFDSRTSVGGRPSFWAMKELSKLTHRPYQERAYRKLKRACAKNSPPKRETVAALVHALNTDKFRRMPDKLKDLLFECDAVTWEHIRMIHDPEGQEFERFNDVKLSVRDMERVARWVARGAKSLRETKEYVLKLLDRKRKEGLKAQEQGGDSGKLDDADVTAVVKELGTMERKLKDLCSLPHDLAKDNPTLLRQLRLSTQLLHDTADTLLSVIASAKEVTSEMHTAATPGLDQSFCANGMTAKTLSVAAGSEPMTREEANR